MTISERTSSATDALGPSGARADLAERPNLLIKTWALVGGLVLAFEAYVIFKWVTGPYFTPVNPGPSEPPGWMMISLRAMEVVFVALWAWCLWNYVLKPYLRERRFTTDGLLCLGFFFYAWFQDPLANFGGPVFTYNSHLFNMGSWLNEVPGVTSIGQPGAQLSEPLWSAAIYPGLIFAMTVFGTAVMRRIKAWRPRTSKFGVIAGAWVFFVVFDLILEGFVLMPLGAYTYAGAPDWLSINVDHYYKFTFVEALSFGTVWTAWASLRYFKDDRGNTLVERGLERLQGSELKKTVMRFLALGGFVAMTQMLFVNVPFYWAAQNMSTYPVDVQKRSYFTQGMCGEGTTSACFGPSIPVPNNHSARVSPDGKLYIPPGTTLPPLVPIDRGPLGPDGG